MSIFKPGQLVRFNEDYGDGASLYNVPGGFDKNALATSMILRRDVAVVIAVGRSDGSQVYVLGPHGGGWTFGAFLKILKEPTP